MSKNLVHKNLKNYLIALQREFKDGQRSIKDMSRQESFADALELKAQNICLEEVIEDLQDIVDYPDEEIF